MFTRFEAPEPSESSPPRQKRSQVTKACESCRIHRVKCDNDYPCSNCRKRGGQCSNNSANKLATLPQAYREIEGLRLRIQELERELELQKRRKKPRTDITIEFQQLNTPPSLPPSLPPTSEPDTRDVAVALGGGSGKGFWEGIHISTARSSQTTWFGSSSLFYFIGRMNTFLSTALQQPRPANRMLPDSASKLLDGPTALSTEDQPTAKPDDPIIVGDYLSPTQEEYFLSLFWQSYHTVYPVLDEAEFKEHYQSLWTSADKERKPSALVDIVIALCMQYGMALMPNVGRGTSAASRAVVGSNDATIAGRWHYQRCHTLLSSELETPTIATLQCHILCSIYLCCGSFTNIADSACSLAVRTAYTLGLHFDPPPSMSQRKRELNRRIWWTLYVLESKMSMKLGRPFLLHGFNTTHSLPADNQETAMLSGSNFSPLGENITWLTWNLHSTKLMLAARAAHTAFYDKDPNTCKLSSNIKTIWEGCELLESYAEFFSPHMQRLEEWANGVPKALTTKRQNNGRPFSTDLSALEIEQFAPLWLQRQRLLLELMYHNLSLNLCRPFISFVSSAVPTPLADKLAMKCTEHAAALTHMMHQTLSSYSILGGWHEAFQWQWNAAMTLIGFVLAYPQAVSAQASRNAIDLSVAVLENFGNSFAAAASAANIVRELSPNIDLLIEKSRRTNGHSKVGSAPPPGEMQPAVADSAEAEEVRGEGFSIDDNFVITSEADVLLNFEDTAAAMQGALAQSIDTMLDIETYKSFGNDFEMFMSSMKNDYTGPWIFTQQAIE